MPRTEKIRFPEVARPKIRIIALASVSTDLRIRGFDRDGFFQQRLDTTSNRTRQLITFEISDLPINIRVATAWTIRRGRVYVYGLLYLAGFPVLQLFSGYVSGGRPLTWPPGVFEEPLSGPGYKYSLAGTDPSAGGEISQTVPTNACWRLRSIRFSLTTDATVADRRVALLIDDGTNELFRIIAPATQGANLTRHYIFAPHGLDTTRNDHIYAQIPGDLRLFQGWRIRTTTSNLQTGDDFGAPRLFVEEWLED